MSLNVEAVSCYRPSSQSAWVFEGREAQWKSDATENAFKDLLRHYGVCGMSKSDGQINLTASERYQFMFTRVEQCY
jgi:hypothetical protein